MREDSFDYDDEVFEEDASRLPLYMQDMIARYFEEVKLMQTSIVDLEHRVEQLEKK